MNRETVASIKGSKTSRRQEEPRQGTDLRDLYDALIATKGDLTKLVPARQFVGRTGSSYALEHLRNDYLLDIRATRGRNGGACLVGRWDGDKYIDYVAERLGL